jgi:hypothetical protein
MKVTYKPNEQGLEQFLAEYYATKLPTIAVTVEGSVKSETPINTGALIADIKREVDVENKTVFVGNNLEYSVFVNLGTRKQAPNPYLIRGMDGAAKDIVDYLGSKK